MPIWVSKNRIDQTSDLWPLDGLHRNKMLQKSKNMIDQNFLCILQNEIKCPFRQGKVHGIKKFQILKVFSFLILHKNLMVLYKNSTIFFLPEYDAP